MIREGKGLVPSQTACPGRAETETLSARPPARPRPVVEPVTEAEQSIRLRGGCHRMPGRDLQGPAAERGEGGGQRVSLRMCPAPSLGSPGPGPGCRPLSCGVIDPGRSVGRLPASTEDFRGLSFLYRILRGQGVGGYGECSLHLNADTGFSPGTQESFSIKMLMKEHTATPNPQATPPLPILLHSIH